MNACRTCLLLLAVLQLGAMSVSRCAEPKSQNSETDGNAIFAAIADRYRKTDTLRTHGSVQVSFASESRVIEEQFEISFDRGKEISVRVGELQPTSPAIIGYEKSFRIREGKAHEYVFGVETKRYESSQEEFLQSPNHSPKYRLVHTTLPSLLLLDESAFFSDHSNPTGWTIENTDSLPESCMMLKLHWVKGVTLLKVCPKDRTLLECEIRFDLANLKSASFTFEDGGRKGSRTQE